MLHLAGTYETMYAGMPVRNARRSNRFDWDFRCIASISYALVSGYLVGLGTTKAGI